jgi:hypothetical protein
MYNGALTSTKVQIPTNTDLRDVTLVLHLPRSHTLLHFGLLLELVQHGVLLLAEPLEVHAVVRACV